MRSLHPLHFGFVLFLVGAFPLSVAAATFGAGPDGGAGTGAERWFCWDADGCHNVLSAIAFLSATDGWAVGYGGDIVRWNGSQWRLTTSPTTEYLNGVAVSTNPDMPGGNEAWAVGYGGIILYWNGLVWAQVPSPTERELYAVVNATRDRGWAVGEDGTILVRNGATWSVALSPTGDDLYGLTVDSSGRGWAVGNVRGILRYLPGAYLPLVLVQYGAITPRGSALKADP